MAYVGNRAGPRKSEIARRLGPDYFGISPEELSIEIELYLADEFSGVVDPVHEDREGRYFIVFNAPGGRTQKFYLEDHGYCLEGYVDKILTEDDD